MSEMIETIDATRESDARYRAVNWKGNHKHCAPWRDDIETAREDFDALAEGKPFARTLTINTVSSTAMHRSAVHYTIYGSDDEGALYFYVLTNSAPPKVGDVVLVTGAKLSPTQPANYIKIPHDTERANRIMDALEMIGYTAAHQFCGIGAGASIEIKSNAPLSIFRALIDETK